MILSDITENKVKDFSKIISAEVEYLGDVMDKAGYEVRIVGGAVRDLVLGKNPKDIDMATDARPNEMIKVFDKTGIRWEPTGIDHGTLTVIIDGEPIEITSLRIDTNQDGRHAEVAFTKDWKLDAERRDLTYNAMSMSLDGTLHDYFGGEADLKNAVTKAVGDTRERFHEDYLRIMRMFRFGARYGHELDSKTMEAIMWTAEGLKGISGERVWMEMQKILSGPNPEIAVQGMIHTGVDKMIGLNVTHFENLDLAKHQDAILTLAGIIDSDNARFLAKKWKMSTEDKERLTGIQALKFNNWSDAEMKSQIVKHKRPEFLRGLFVDLFKINRKPDTISKWDIPVFPVQGRDLIQAGHTAGPSMGKALASMKQAWIDSNFTVSKEDLLQSVLK